MCMMHIFNCFFAWFSFHWLLVGLTASMSSDQRLV